MRASNRIIHPSEDNVMRGAMVHCAMKGHPSRWELDKGLGEEFIGWSNNQFNNLHFTVSLEIDNCKLKQTQTYMLQTPSKFLTASRPRTGSGQTGSPQKCRDSPDNEFSRKIVGNMATCDNNMWKNVATRART